MTYGKARKYWLLPAAALALALLCELLLFNGKALLTLGKRWTALPQPSVSGNPEEGSAQSFGFYGLEQEFHWVHLLAVVRDADGQIVPTEMTVYLSDEGHKEYYQAGTVSYISEHDKGSYFRVNSYGKIHGLRIQVQAPEAGSSVTLVRAEIEGSVPLRVSLVRVLGLLALLLLLYALRPSSGLYDNRVWNRRPWAKLLCVLLLLLLELGMLFSLAGSNRSMVEIPDEPNWQHHHQYAKLARALAAGETSIETAEEARALELLGEMENPYDYTARRELFRENNAVSPWDTAYYNGHLYVYFGVVPVLLAYLPYYLLTGSDLPTWCLAAAASFFVILSAFLCMRAIVRRYFPETPFPVFLLLSLLLGNAAGVLYFALYPSFYIVPVYFALGFVYCALALWLSAARRWDLEMGKYVPISDFSAYCFAEPSGKARRGGVGIRILLGALCAALVAGCRPQFLVFSALALPIFLPFIRPERGAVLLRRVLLFVLPYLAVALPLMYYNAIRFGSPLDFGANYNLTTNDMPHRGWNWARLPDGFLAYLLRTPDLRLQYPYFFPASTNPVYMGKTVTELMFGGVLLISPFLWFLLGLRKAKAVLRGKKAWLLTLLPLGLSLIVIATDTEMAGILWRYTADFLALLYLPAALVVLALLAGKPSQSRNRLLGLLLAATVFTLLSCLLISISDSFLPARSPETYYRLKDLLSWG